jgi:hypothetical protein
MAGDDAKRASVRTGAEDAPTPAGRGTAAGDRTGDAVEWKPSSSSSA